MMFVVGPEAWIEFNQYIDMIDPSESFEATYAVPMHCGDCTGEISRALRAVPGVQEVTPDLERQLVAVRGIAPPLSLIHI